MQSYIFIDLDDTLFQSLRKCPTHHNDPTTLQARAFLADGTAISYATPKQQWLWHSLNKGFKIVPVTARNYDAFSRVNLPFREEIVLNHGAVILNKHRTVDKAWMALMRQKLPEYQNKLLEVWAEVERYAARRDGFKPRLIKDFDTLWYGVIKHGDHKQAALEMLLTDLIADHPFVTDGSLYWHLNDNNLALLPKIVSKENAVSYLMDGYKQQHPELVTFGAGDSHTDAAFMALCDYALIPNNTQLFQSLACTESA